MRYPSDLPREPRPSGGSGRGRSSRLGPTSRIILAVVAVVFVVLAFSLRTIATVWTDFLWFDALDRTEVWSNLMVVRIGLGIAATGFFFLLLFLNLVLVDRLSPRFVPSEDDLVVRFQELVAGRRRQVWAVVALTLAIIPGLSATGRWRDWMLFRHGGSFGITDPQFGVDIGFFVFKLPFLSQLVDWLFGFLVITLMVVTVAHYLNGGIRAQSMGERITTNAKRHISALLAVAALVKAADYLLRRFELTLNRDGASGIDGAGYTAVNATLPAVNLLTLIAVASALIFLINVFRRGWTLPVIAIAIWGIVALLVAGAYPALIQRFRVEPSELSREREFVQRNIEATREALDLDRVEFDPFVVDGDLTADEVADAEDTIRNLRIQDPNIILRTIQNLQFERDYYTFRDVDVDRYEIDGVMSPMVVSARELNLGAESLGSWERRHLVFTHGYALSAAPANEKNERSEPNFVVQGVPARSVRDFPELERPHIYHGEGMGGYAIVGTGQTELSSDDVATTYEGTGGVGIGSAVRRAAFALRYWEIEPLISEYLTNDSRIIFQRDVLERVGALAPFLTLDGDPYPVVDGGRVKYVVDAYTATDAYPYAQMVDAATVLGGRGVSGQFSYLRNSVKAVVDAYDGTVDLYLVDEALYGKRDPIARAWASAFPGLFVEGSEMPEAIRAHLRYPEFLFKVQTHMWGRYHQVEPDTFFNNSDRWAVGQQPPAQAGANATTLPGAGAGTGLAPRIDPYYQLMVMPGEEEAEFVLTRPFVLYSDNDSARNLVAMMVARNDGDRYGNLSVMVMSDGNGQRAGGVDGPLTASQKIAVNTRFTAFQTLADNSGSRVQIGNLLIVPVGNSLLYVRPVFLQQDEGGRPQLQKVVALSGDRFGFGDTTRAAIRDLLSGLPEPTDVDPLDPGSVLDRPGTTTTTAPPTTVPDGGTPPAPVDRDVDALIADASSRLNEADAALRAGDLGAYQRLVGEASDLLDQALQNGTPAPAADTAAGGAGA